MPPDLQDLRITFEQLEKLTGLEINEISIGRVYRPSAFRNSKRLLAVLVTELLTFGLILIFCLPLGLIVARGFGTLSGDARSTTIFLQVMLSISVAIALIWKGYLWQKSKALKTLAHLLDEVDKHNEIIEAVRIINELESVGQSTVALTNREEIMQALSATRESLVSALMTERILRKHQRFIARRHELFANIEENLAMLQTLQVNSQASEYGQLLNEALRIGMSVQQELSRY